MKNISRLLDKKGEIFKEPRGLFERKLKGAKAVLFAVPIVVILLRSQGGS